MSIVCGVTLIVCAPLFFATASAVESERASELLPVLAAEGESEPIAESNSPALESSEDYLWPLNQSTTQYSSSRLGYEGLKKDTLKLMLFSENYLNRQSPPAGVADYTQVGGHLRSQTQGQSAFAVIDVGGSFATGVENYNNLYVPEAFFAFSTPNWDFLEKKGMSRLRFSVGRKLENWSSIDRNWDLGQWEPLNRFDALRPVDQGLTGLFFEVARGRTSAVLFGSAVYIPEQGAPFELNNGNFQSASPWFSPLPTQLRLGSSLRPVRYELETPAVGSVIRQTTIGGLIRHGNPNEGFWIQGSYMYKPRNQIATPFRADLSLTETTNFARVQVEPTVLYHQLAAFESFYRGSGFSLGLSGLADIPIDQQFDSELTYQAMQPLVFVSPSVEFRGQMFGRAKWSLGASYLGSFGEPDQSIGPNALGDDTVFSSRTPFREAIALDGKIAQPINPRLNGSFGLRAIEELSEQGSILMVDLGFEYSSRRGGAKDWRFSLMADILGTELDVTEKRGYASRFRQNDRVITQLQYVF